MQVPEVSSPERSDRERELDLTPRQLLLAVSLGAVISFLAGVGLGKGTIGHCMLAYWGFFGFGSSTLFLAIVVEVGFLLFRRKLGSRLWHIWVLLLAPLTGIFLSYEYYAIPNQRRVAAAYEACEELIPRLEAQRIASGAYPARVEPWMDLDRLDIEYLTDDGQSYRLKFVESVETIWGLPHVHEYDSSKADWYVWPD
jgi:hypothetical protein